MVFGEFITTLLSWGTLIAHGAIILFIFFLLVKNSIADRVVSWVGTHALGLSLLISLSGVAGSLLYSEGVGFVPCMLCWVQRIFLYPQIVLFGLALWWKDKRVLPYAFALSVLGGVVALYHSFTNLGGHSFLPCTAEGSACSKLYVLEFGYITIPMMALTLFIALILVFVAYRRVSRVSSIM